MRQLPTLTLAVLVALSTASAGVLAGGQTPAPPQSPAPQPPQLPTRGGEASIPAPDEKTGVLAGEARDARGQKMSAAKVRVRNAATGTVAAEVVSDVAGGFAVAGLAPATYVVEVVSIAGQVVGLSPAIAVAAGMTATVTVTATAVGAIAAAAAGGGFSVLGLGTAASVAVAGAATAAAVAGVVAVVPPASPSS
jgi:hypothetical protein